MHTPIDVHACMCTDGKISYSAQRFLDDYVVELQVPLSDSQFRVLGQFRV